jgi:hypothetical protein
LNYYPLGTDTGYATDNSFRSYYTYDGWKTITQNPPSEQALLGITQVSAGYVAYKSVNSTVSDVYFSKDLQTWTKKMDMSKTGASPFTVFESGGKLTIFSRANRYIVSYDGGETFKAANKNGNSDFISELIVMSDTNTTTFSCSRPSCI